MAARKSPEEKEAERRAKLCKCSASCQIPAKSFKPEYGTTTRSCACPDYSRRAGSYRCPIQGDAICAHIHARRVEAFQAPEGSPLAQFQDRNPLGTIEETERLITRLCGPASSRVTNASLAIVAHKQAYVERMTPQRALRPIQSKTSIDELFERLKG